jgi:hypothetical protein
MPEEKTSMVSWVMDILGKQFVGKLDFMQNVAERIIRYKLRR